VPKQQQQQQLRQRLQQRQKRQQQVREQQRVRELGQVPALLFCRKRPGQRQRSRRPE